MGGGTGYVEVRDEPRHRYRFENPYLYLYDVLIPPGDLTLYHRHAEDTLYVAITGGVVTAQELGGERQTLNGQPGRCLCQTHRTHPLVHQIGNVGTRDVRLIGAEVKASPPVTTAAALDAPGHELEWETQRLRAYRIVLPPGKAIPPVTYRFSGLTVFLTDGCLASDAAGAAATTFYSAGDWIWHDGPATRALANVGREPVAAVLVEWR